jgi:hypothetical protein
VKITDLWARLEATFGPGYAQSVAHDQVIPGLGRTIEEALAGGDEIADVWRAVVAAFPDRVPARLH